jgi:hypothetical protein
MFRKFLIFAIFATACGYVFASDDMAPVPVWPEPGSEADVRFYGENAAAGNNAYVYEGMEDFADDMENVRIVSKIGADLVVENNFNLGGRGSGFWSGGADLTQPYQAPAGFNIYEGRAEMPLMHSEMPEDDGGEVLSISRSDRKKTKVFGPGGVYASGGGAYGTESKTSEDFNFETEAEAEESSAALGAAAAVQDQVRSWVVVSGRTLRSVLQEWCDKEGWDLVWNTSREYPIQASAVFKGRFMDVSSALVRNFSRANPVPYAKFYKGNRVLLVSTNEE